VATQRTLAIIKPDAFRKGYTGPILSRVEQSGFRIIGLRLTRLDVPAARAFYHVHRDRHFFDELCGLMTCGPIVVMVLEAESAISRWRDLIGPTDAAVAGPDTIRGQFGESVSHNAVHGSDAPEAADFEISFFFDESDLV